MFQIWNVLNSTGYTHTQYHSVTIWRLLQSIGLYLHSTLQSVHLQHRHTTHTQYMYLYVNVYVRVECFALNCHCLVCDTRACYGKRHRNLNKFQCRFRVSFVCASYIWFCSCRCTANGRAIFSKNTFTPSEFILKRYAIAQPKSQTTKVWSLLHILFIAVNKLIPFFVCSCCYCFRSDSFVRFTLFRWQHRWHWIAYAWKADGNNSHIDFDCVCECVYVWLVECLLSIFISDIFSGIEFGSLPVPKIDFNTKIGWIFNRQLFDFANIKKSFFFCFFVFANFMIFFFAFARSFITNKSI